MKVLPKPNFIETVITLSCFLILVCLCGCDRSSSEAEFNQLPTNAQEDNISMVSEISEVSTNLVSDWPRFRGPTGMGVVDEAVTIPLEWSSESGVRWKSPLPGPGASSPIVYGDRVYVTCYTGYLGPESGEPIEKLRRHLIAVNRQDGTIVWDKAIEPALPEELKIRDHGYAANTPLVDEHHIYFFLGKTGILALDHDGNEVWKRNVGHGASGWGTASSPVPYKDFIIINAAVESGALVALNRMTGEVAWTTGGIKESWNTPIITQSPDGRDELVVGMIGQLRGYNPDKGTSYWTCDTGITWYMVPSGVSRDGFVYYLGGRSGITMLSVLTGGNGNVTDTHLQWTERKGSNVSSPVIHGDHLYWVHDQRGIAYCARLKSGEIIYEERLERPAQFYSSAIIHGENIYYLDRNGKTYVVRANPEFEVVATNDLSDGSQFNGSPAAAGNNLFIRSDKFLYCLGE